MTSDLINRLRIDYQAGIETVVELPENPLRGPHLPPDFKGMAAPEVPFDTEPQPSLEERLGIEKPSRSNVSLGIPQHVRLRSAPAGDTSGLEPFMNTTETAYYLVHLACSFDPIPEEHFSGGSIEVSLDLEDMTQQPVPVAWSMKPRCLPQLTEMSRSQKVDASAKIVGVAVSQETKTTRTKCLVQAFNELQSNPRWDFRPTKVAQLVGTQRLIMVVKAQGRVIGSVVLKAEIARRRFPRAKVTQLVIGPKQFHLRN